MTHLRHALRHHTHIDAWTLGDLLWREPLLLLLWWRWRTHHLPLSLHRHPLLPSRPRCRRLLPSTILLLLLLLLSLGGPLRLCSFEQLRQLAFEHNTLAFFRQLFFRFGEDVGETLEDRLGSCGG